MVRSTLGGSAIGAGIVVTDAIWSDVSVFMTWRSLGSDINEGIFFCAGKHDRQFWEVFQRIVVMLNQFI